MNRNEMMKQAIQASKEFFDRSSRLLVEEHSGFTPAPGMFTAAQQIAHIAHTIEWFLDGAFSPAGFDMDWEKHSAELRKVTSLTVARASLDKAYARAIETLSTTSDAELSAPMADGPIMGGAPRYHAFSSIIEHTAHHRGALTVYTRLLGSVPPMPYME